MAHEFRLLAFMAKNAGIVLTAEKLSPAIWLDDNHSARDAARIVFALRQKLGDDDNAEWSCLYKLYSSYNYMRTLLTVTVQMQILFLT